MKQLVIYELDPTGGCCGFPAEIPGLPPADAMRHELVRRNRIAKQLESELNIQVKRIFLRSPGALIESSVVKSFISAQGNNAFPVFLVDETIIHSGNFPDYETIAKKISGQ